MTTLADLTTIRVGGPILNLVHAETEAELIDAIRHADDNGTGLLVLGGGSNILASDAPFDGVVVRDARRDIRIESEDAYGAAVVTITAGTPWEETVEAAVTSGWAGLEALTGIPGSTGATPVQNVGAYGQEVSEVIATVRCWDRGTDQIRTFAARELGFGYRTSVLKRSLGPQFGYTPRYVVLSVTFQMPLATLSAPVRYAELARELDVPLNQRVNATEVRAAVQTLRRGKGMVLDPGDHDTWSAGSFFTNPIVPKELIPHGAPAFPTQPPLGADPAKEWLKISAAWLISHAGFAKGFTLGAPAALSTKHVLALTNRGGARAEDIVELARTVRERVVENYGITLVPEPILINLTLG